MKASTKHARERMKFVTKIWGNKIDVLPLSPLHPNERSHVAIEIEPGTPGSVWAIAQLLTCALPAPGDECAAAWAAEKSLSIASLRPADWWW